MYRNTKFNSQFKPRIGDVVYHYDSDPKERTCVVIDVTFIPFGTPYYEKLYRIFLIPKYQFNLFMFNVGEGIEYDTFGWSKNFMFRYRIEVEQLMITNII